MMKLEVYAAGVRDLDKSFEPDYKLRPLRGTFVLLEAQSSSDSVWPQLLAS
jgi:hypothetical protein